MGPINGWATAVRFPAGTPAENGSNAGRSPRPAMLICGGLQWRRRGPTDTGPRSGLSCAKRPEGLGEEVKEIAWKAQHRLHKRYRNLLAAGKEKQKVVTAVGRELLGFIWAIGVQVEGNRKPVA